MIRSNRFGTMQVWLPIAGIASALIYLLAFTLPNQLTAFARIPSTQLKNETMGIPPLLLLECWIALFGIYYLGYRLCGTGVTRWRLAAVIAFPVLCSLILLFMYPLASTDIFFYLFHGHIIAHYHMNAYLTTPSAFPNDPLLPYVNWKELPLQYGIVWYWLSGATSLLAGTDLLTNLFAYKLLVIAHLWGSIVLVYQIGKVYKPAQTLRALYLFAWNPLLLYEVAGNGHNDMVLICWLLVAICWLVRGGYTLSLLAVMVAILMKYTPALLLPLFLIAFWRGQRNVAGRVRLKRLVVAGVGMGLLAVVLYLPLGVESILASYSNLSGRTQFFISSIPTAVLYALLRIGVDEAVAQGITRNVFMLFMGGVVFWQAIGLLRRRVADHTALVTDVVQRSFTVIFAYVAVACLYFWPWYLTWLLAFAPFLTRFGYAQRTTLICLTATFAPFVAGYYLIMHAQDFDMLTFELWKIVTIFLLPLLLTVALWLYQLRRPVALSSSRRPPIAYRESGVGDAGDA